ncbi:BTB domain-containing protein/NPH3 domain-containing protein [Cephalotus follicularis]|uniref:BTB domain-containing protein/NPH3 domain-containing protein n=1 Tax=Cephalotus follicularis TaxID=3775 RepID=A0A1Q3ASI1_CEPFO|nr:BTB domain-containing protein/NPH3 domain-containing protein [Cephalotus follicularis]
MSTTPVMSNDRHSISMERTGQWIISQDIPSDVVVVVGEANFSLHKFMLVAKSNYIRGLIMESKESGLTRIDLSDIPGGPEIFEKAAKFCYGVNFEITVHNVAALRCAAEYLQMTDKYCDRNLAGRTDDFLTQAALTTLSGAIVVLRSCHQLLPFAEDLKIVQRCVDVISFKACNEANFPSRSPLNWWAEELSIIDIEAFGRVIGTMKQRGAKAQTLASAIITYTERSLRDIVRDHSGNGTKASTPLRESDLIRQIQQRQLLESIVTILPSEKAAFPINFLCCLLRSAISLQASISCKNELEKRITAILEHVTVDDLLVLSFTFDGERLLGLDSVGRIISGFVDKEKSMAVFNAGDFRQVYSSATQRVAKTVDTYLGEIATCPELGISKFNGIANLVPDGARKIEDDLYRAIDIYLKAHPNLDEIEREKACSVMDPLKLSYEARVHASQNKRLPVNVVLHALYYDQLKLRSGPDDQNMQDDAVSTRNQLRADVSLVKENEVLRTELMKMKLYIADMHKNIDTANSNHGLLGTSSNAKAASSSKKPTFFSSMSRKLGKLNPFKLGSKDTSHVDDSAVDITKPRKRRFSIS